MPVSHFFDRAVTAVVGPIERPFRVLGVTYNHDRDEATVDYINPPIGPSTSREPEKVIGSAVDRATVVEAVARTARVYSRRVSRATGRTIPVGESWAAELRQDFPRWFDIDFECHGGWADLIRAMSEWLWELGLPTGFKFDQVKEKFAGLRAYASVRTLTAEQANIVDGRIDACEVISPFICERCGEPGRPRQKNGFFYAACEKYA
jgi:hypothetical protein